MTKFKFRLEVALRLRRMRAEAETARLQELVAHQKRLRDSLLALRDDRVEASGFVQASEHPGVQDLRALALFTLGLEARARTVQEGIEKTAELISKQKERTLEARRDERCLEKLRAKRLKEWTLQSQRELETAAQELWLISHTKEREGL